MEVVITDKIKLSREDNMELMSRYEDNYFDLAIVDPPYGCSWGGVENLLSGNVKKSKNFASKAKKWDSAPTKDYFKQLKRVSKNQIIWGYNYFTDKLGNCNNLILWDKKITGLKYLSRFELAYCSFNNNVIKQINSIKDNKIHPTQKPVKLYEWLLMNYAKEGDKILDTHLGSGSIAIACHNLGFELTACELDEEYFNAACKRIEHHTKQLRMF